jgi:hypothetical protein
LNLVYAKYRIASSGIKVTLPEGWDLGWKKDGILKGAALY